MYKVTLANGTELELDQTQINEGCQIHLIRYGSAVPDLLGAIIYAEENLGIRAIKAERVAEE